VNCDYNAWLKLRDAGIDEIPGNDFSLYDHVLDTAWLLGAIPARHVAAVPDVSTPAGRLTATSRWPEAPLTRRRWR
jgi:hypothetical protein